MDSLADAVVVVDGNRTVLDMNAAAVRLAGSPADWAGMPADSLFPFLAGAAIAGAGAAGEITVDTPQASYDVRVSRARADRAAWIVVLRDVSEQRRAIAEREQFVAQNNEMVSRVTHELRTPVAAVQGALQLLRAAGEPLTPDQQRLLDTALHSCERLRRIVEEILDLSTIDSARTPPARPQPLAVERLLVDALLDVGRLAGTRGVRIQTSLAQDLPLVVGEHDRLVQVFVQLLSNAIAHSPQGESVTVSAWPEGTSVAIAVSDRGDGIRAGQADRVLASPGLATARALVQQHGGRLAIDRTSGQGATFVVRLPQTEVPASVATPPAPPAAAPAPLRPARILVADDDADLRDVLIEALAGRGFEVVAAADGKEALDILDRERIDLAVLDINMPHYRGDEVIRRLRGGTRQPQLPVVVLTGTLDQRDTPDVGADVLLTKPADLRRLLAEVQALLQKNKL